MPVTIYEIDDGLIFDGGNRMAETARMARQLKTDKAVFADKPEKEIKKQRVERTQRPNGETMVVYERYNDGSKEIHVEGPFHVDNRRPRGQNPTTF